jgi:hypothetical protein
MENVIFFHEDFYKQIELIPRQNYFAANRVIEELPEPNGSGAGFLSCTIRPEHLVKVEDLKIPFNDVKSLLDPLALSFHNKITSGYSTTTYKVENTVAWAFERFGIFIEHEEGIVNSIWLCKSAKFPSDNTGKVLIQALKTLSINFNLILADWNQEVIVDISKEKKLNNYLVDVLAFELVN